MINVSRRYHNETESHHAIANLKYILLTFLLLCMIFLTGFIFIFARAKTALSIFLD